MIQAIFSLLILTLFIVTIIISFAFDIYDLSEKKIKFREFVSKIYTKAGLVFIVYTLMKIFNALHS